MPTLSPVGWHSNLTLGGLLKLFAFHKCMNIWKILLLAKYFGPDPWVQLCLIACLDKPKWFKRVKHSCMWPYRNPGNFCAETSSEDQWDEWPKFNQPKAKQLSPHIPPLKPLTDVSKTGLKEVWAQAAIQDQLLFPFIATFTSASPGILENVEGSLCLFVCWRSVKNTNGLLSSYLFLLTTDRLIFSKQSYLPIISIQSSDRVYGAGTAPSLWCPFNHWPTETSQAGTAV